MRFFSRNNGHNQTVKAELPVVTYAKFLSNVHSDSAKFPLGDKSIEEVAKQACPHDYAITTCRYIDGTARVDGKSVKISSMIPGSAKRFFLGGQIQPLDELTKASDGDSFDEMLRKLLLAGYGDLAGINQVIKTRTGEYEPYLPDMGDSILPMNADTEDSAENLNDENDGLGEDELDELEILARAKQNSVVGNPNEVAVSPLEDTPPAEVVAPVEAPESPEHAYLAN